MDLAAEGVLALTREEHNRLASIAGHDLASIRRDVSFGTIVQIDRQRVRDGVAVLKHDGRGSGRLDLYALDAERHVHGHNCDGAASILRADRRGRRVIFAAGGGELSGKCHTGRESAEPMSRDVASRRYHGRNRKLAVCTLPSLRRNTKT